MDRGRSGNPPSRPLVLIVDGHHDTCTLYTDGLCRLGFEVTAADDGAQAYERACTSHPDVIVTEVTLPNRDGWDLLRRLKSDPRTRAIPVAVVTCQATPAVRERAERVGCAVFLVKPCVPTDLASHLRQLLEQRAHAPAC
jgi:CheY-like chemotaxis protein